VIPGAVRTQPQRQYAIVIDFPLEGSGSCSAEARRLGFTTFAQIAEHIRSLPYGRVQGDPEGLAVLRHGRGTCSSKHRYLAILARECGRNDVRLTLGLYEMSEHNTPGVGMVLQAAALQSVPEVHCYLTWQGRRYDFTGLPRGSSSPFESLTEEKPVLPEDLPTAKVQFHRYAMVHWAQERGVDPELAWNVRERCMEALSPIGSVNRDTAT
jgi:hypothetical protein